MPNCVRGLTRTFDSIVWPTQDITAGRRLFEVHFKCLLDWPFMIGICQGQTELSSPLLPTERSIFQRFLIGRAQYRLIGSVFVLVQFAFRLRVFGSSRGQRPSVTSHSFARIQPSEGLHGRLSL